MAYYRVEPFGMMVQNTQVARGIALTANLNRKKGSQTTYTAEDFTVGHVKPPKEKQSSEELAEKLKKAFGNRLVKKKKTPKK